MNSVRVRTNGGLLATRGRLLVAFFACAFVASACRAPHADAARTHRDAEAAEPAPQSPPPVEIACPAYPPSVDLRAEFERFGFVPRGQGPRPTCSIFAATAAFEFALAELGEPVRLSPEFVNWAASAAVGARGDGNFFHNALAGFERFGASAAELCAYRETFDPAFEPSAEALADAAARRERTGAQLVVHWTVPWVPDRFGLDEQQFAEFKRVLAAGHPIAAGSAHSRLLVGYRDDAAAPGGGVFLVLDSALASYTEIDYAFARAQVADAFWIEPRRGE
ncbi:MAG: hypothetical protein L6Q99_11275 [Planctomycetes bacterium]|nr:hypothetical protein [Planctomycetota bacterium]